MNRLLRRAAVERREDDHASLRAGFMAGGTDRSKSRALKLSSRLTREGPDTSHWRIRVAGLLEQLVRPGLTSIRFPAPLLPTAGTLAARPPSRVTLPFSQ
jgi:hypothetical protein